MVYWVDDHYEMAYIETNIESESDLGFDIHVFCYIMLASSMEDEE